MTAPPLASLEAVRKPKGELVESIRSSKSNCFFCGKRLVGDELCIHPEISGEFAKKATEIMLAMDFCDHFCCGMPATLCRTVTLAKALSSELRAREAAVREAERERWTKFFHKESGTTLDFTELCEKAASYDALRAQLDKAGRGEREGAT